MTTEDEKYYIGDDPIESPTNAVRFDKLFRPKLSTGRVVSLDSGGYRPQGSRRVAPSVPSTRSLSAAAVIERHGMVPLNFAKVNDDKAHPLSSLRSCSEFGLHGVDGTVKRQENAPRKKSIWRRAVNWIRRDKITESSTPVELSLRERSELAQMGDSHRARAMGQRPALNHSRGTHPGRLPSVDSVISMEIVPNKLRYRANEHIDGTSWVGAFNDTFWQTLGFDVQKFEPMEFEMKTFKITGAWIHTAPEILSTPMSRVSSARSLLSSHSSRDNLSIHSAGGGSSGNRIFEDPAEGSFFIVMFSDLLQFLYIYKLTQRCIFIWNDLLNKAREISFRLGNDEFNDMMRMQPVASSAHLRFMLFTGIMSTVFNGFTMTSWPVSSESIASIPGATFVYVWYAVITALHVLKMPLRLAIHLKLIGVPQVASRAGIDILRDLTDSDLWMSAKLIEWTTDGMSLIGLLGADLYIKLILKSRCLGPDDPANTLRNLIVIVSATTILNFMLRSAVSLLFCISAVNPDTLREARRRGLSKWDVDKLPSFVYSDRDEVNNPACSICLCAFDLGEMLICLPCDNRHSFHAGCIRDWLTKQNACPLCQKVL